MGWGGGRIHDDQHMLPTVIDLHLEDVENVLGFLLGLEESILEATIIDVVTNGGGILRALPEVAMAVVC